MVLEKIFSIVQSQTRSACGGHGYLHRLSSFRGEKIFIRNWPTRNKDIFFFLLLDKFWNSEDFFNYIYTLWKVKNMFWLKILVWCMEKYFIPVFFLRLNSINFVTGSNLFYMYIFLKFSFNCLSVYLQEKMLYKVWNYGSQYWAEVKKKWFLRCIYIHVFYGKKRKNTGFVWFCF
jgi:Zn-dependent protease with chaperone function